MKKLTFLAALLLTTSVVFAGCMRPAPEPAPTYEPPAETTPADPAPETTAPEPMDSLHDRVHAALDRAPNLDASNISVRVEGNDVYLSGTVPNKEQHELAHEVAHSVEGVDRVFHQDLTY